MNLGTTSKSKNTSKRYGFPKVLATRSFFVASSEERLDITYTIKILPISLLLAHPLSVIVQECWPRHVEGCVQDVADEDVPTSAKKVDKFLLNLREVWAHMHAVRELETS